MGAAHIVGYIYQITNVVNGKVYIGCTSVSLKHRLEQHLSAVRHGSPLALHNAIRKYGPSNFRIECVDTIKGTYTDLLAAEVRHIAAKGSAAPRGYNLTGGGEGVDYTLPETRERLLEGIRRRASNSEWLKNTSEANRKKAKDPAWLEATREASRKKRADPEWHKAIQAGAVKRQNDPEWLKSVTEAAKKRAEDPKWKAAQVEALRQLHADPDRDKAWHDAHNKALRERIRRRDESATPEDIERRAKQRAYKRLRKAIKKLAQGESV